MSWKEITNSSGSPTKTKKKASGWKRELIHIGYILASIFVLLLLSIPMQTRADIYNIYRSVASTDYVGNCLDYRLENPASAVDCFNSAKVTMLPQEPSQVCMMNAEEDQVRLATCYVLVKPGVVAPDGIVFYEAYIVNVKKKRLAKGADDAKIQSGK